MAFSILLVKIYATSKKIADLKEMIKQLLLLLLLLLLLSRVSQFLYILIDGRRKTVITADCSSDQDVMSTVSSI